MSLVISGQDSRLTRSCRAVPQLEDFLDNAALSKTAKANKAAAKGKRKEAGNQTPIMQVDMTAFAAANSFLAPGIVPPAAKSTEGSPAPPASMMRPAFARISGSESAAATPTGSGNASPLGTERTKVKIGFGLKRKAADDEGMSTPPSKR